MPVPFFSDIYKLFAYATKPDPITVATDEERISGVGITSPDANWNFNGSSYWDGGPMPRIQLANSYDFIEMTDVATRKARCKEYDRLENTPEIHVALNTFADEACLAGNTLVATPFGFFTLKELTEVKSPEERFLVYCWDFSKNDYSLGWAFHPRKVKTAETVEVLLDNGKKEIVTPDHRFLLSSGEWREAGELKRNDKLKPFYRLPANQYHTKLKTKQFARIFSFVEGWMHERQFIDEWKSNANLPQYDRLNSISRYIAEGLNIRQLEKATGFTWKTIIDTMKNEGFTYKEFQYLNKKYNDHRNVLGVFKHKELDVYDLSVEEHENFATDSVIVHNCQSNDEGHVFHVKCKDVEVRKEAEFLIHKILEMDDNAWGIERNLCKFGDQFLEVVIDTKNPKKGIQKVVALPAESMFRIETNRGKLMEFQQSDEGPDYQALAKVDLMTATEAEISQTKAIRFHPEQIVHARIGDTRKLFYPYGVSVIEAARGPAHQLRQMEDAMLLYRLVRAPERRVFYIDPGQIPPNRVEAFMDRIKDQFRKKKTFSRKAGVGGKGASAVEERWNPMPPDEDFFIPIRQGSQTRIETLPGACLDLNTKIPLLSGEIKTLNNIIEDFNNGKTLWVTSCNPENGSVVPGKITWAGVTRKNATVVKITLDNGKTVICTPDHKFPMINRGFVEAQHLVSGDSLIAYNTRESYIRSHHKNTYMQVYDNYKKQWVFIHRMVANFFKELDKHNVNVFDEIYACRDKNTIHHFDYNRYNNSPDNLVWMNNIDHFKLHEWIGSEYAHLGGKARADKLSQWKKNGDVRYTEYVQKMKDIFFQWRNSLSKEERININTKISNGLRSFYDNLSVNDKNTLKRSLTQRSKKGIISLNNKLKNKEFKEWFGDRIKSGWDNFRDTPAYKKRSKKISKQNANRWRDANYKNNIQKKQTIVYPKIIMDFVQEQSIMGSTKQKISQLISENKMLIEKWKSSNIHIKRNINFDKFSIWHIDKMMKQFNYSNWSHFQNEVNQYNHRVVSIEFLENKMDVGTITVDGNEEFHNYHTFALDAGIFTKNSNLGEIDDALFFRQRLFTALQFPKNYLTNEDPQASRLTLSQQDVRFARLVERLQKPFAKAVREIVVRHLKLRGFPFELYRDLEVTMTPPSDWRQINRNEVTEVLYNRAATLKGSQLMSDYDILTRILNYDEDDAKEIVARIEAQKFRDLKMQVIAANPDALGLTQPADTGSQIGTGQDGPNPMLSPDGQQQQIPGQEQSPDSMQQGMEQEQGDENPVATPGSLEGGPSPNQAESPETSAAPKLPEPDEEEIKKYDLEIDIDNPNIDDEEVDISELGGDDEEY